MQHIPTAENKLHQTMNVYYIAELQVVYWDVHYVDFVVNMPCTYISRKGVTP